MTNVLYPNPCKVKTLPRWLCDFRVIRFDRASRRDTRTEHKLADFVAGLVTPKPGLAKDELPAWSLCNDTGTETGKPNGLLQMDFDHAEDPETIKALSNWTAGTRKYISKTGKFRCRTIGKTSKSLRIKNGTITEY